MCVDDLDFAVLHTILDAAKSCPHSAGLAGRLASYPIRVWPLLLLLETVIDT
jgi:hypothetical protein